MSNDVNSYTGIVDWGSGKSSDAALPWSGDASSVNDPAGPATAAPAAPAVPYATARSRAMWAVGFLVLVTLLSLGSAASTWLQTDLLQRVKVGTFLADDITQHETREDMLGLALLAASIGSMIAFLMWMHRANRNLRSLGAANPRFTPGWVVGWWFIPIFSLFRPYQAMREIWLASDPGDLVNTENTPWLRPGAAVVGWWWALFLLMHVTGLISGQFASRAEAIDELILSSRISIADSLITVPAALLAIAVIRRITANQDRRHWALVDRAEAARPRA